MSSIFQIELSLITLLIYMLLPFSYYAYSSNFWYDHRRIQFFDFALTIVSSLAICFVLLSAFRAVGQSDWSLELLLLSLAHLGLPCLAFLALSRGTKVQQSKQSAIRQQAQAKREKFKPVGKKDEIEELSWDDLIVSAELKDELTSVIRLLKEPDSAKQYGIQVPKGILFSGPPGTGKTTIAKVVANTAGLSFFPLRADEIVSKWVGESEKNLTDFFKSAQQHSPAVIFIDEIDSLGKKRSDNNAGHADNLLNHLLQLMDGVLKSEGIYIIGATNRPDMVDSALKRAGRLNRVIEIGLPDKQARIDLFGLYLDKINVDPDIDVELLAKVTDGNSAADIKEICNQAGLHSYQREEQLPESQRKYFITLEDIESALEKYEVDEDEFDLDSKKSNDEPKPLNDKVQLVTWDDLIVSDDLRDELNSVIRLLKDPQTAKNYGIDVPKGVLLNGPPGTGKTSLAKAIASTADLAFFVLQTDEVVSKWVGESEKNLTRLFKAAAKHSPSVIFIDEIDSIGKNRAEGNAQHADNLLNHLLQLIDGVIQREGVYVFAATNRADLVDPALKRGGRLNKVIEVPLPDTESRRQLFDLYLKRLNLADAVSTAQLAQMTEGKSHADLKEICNQAGLNAYKRESATGSREYLVYPQDIQAAIDEFTSTQRAA